MFHTPWNFWSLAVWSRLMKKKKFKLLLWQLFFLCLFHIEISLITCSYSRKMKMTSLLFLVIEFEIEFKNLFCRVDCSFLFVFERYSLSFGPGAMIRCLTNASNAAAQLINLSCFYFCTKKKKKRKSWIAQRLKRLSLAKFLESSK